jgi:hypothetical protein
MNRNENFASSTLVVRYSKSAAPITSIVFGLFWKGKTVYEINSLAYHQSDSKIELYRKLILALEKRLVGAFDIALCVANNIKIDLGAERVKCLVLPNGSFLTPGHLPIIDRARPRFVYLGAFKSYYDFAQLFRCFLTAKVGNAELHIYGSQDSYSQQWPEIISKEAIRLMGAYDLKKMLDSSSLSRRDIFILPNGRNRMARIGSPTKLFEYLCFGSRIIYQDYGQASDILGKLDSTYAYRSDDSLIRTLETLSGDFDKHFVSPLTESEYRATHTWAARVREFQEYMDDDEHRGQFG